MSKHNKKRYYAPSPEELEEDGATPENGRNGYELPREGSKIRGIFETLDKLKPSRYSERQELR